MTYVCFRSLAGLIDHIDIASVWSDHHSSCCLVELDLIILRSILVDYAHLQVTKRNIRKL